MRRQMKNFVIAVLVSALFMGVGAGVSYAYMTAKDDASNKFRASSVDVTIEEEFDPPGEITPGEVIKKAPRVHSTSDVDCYVRMAAWFSDSEAEAACEKPVINAGWEKGGDGYYYWQRPLKPGETTGALFDSIRIRQDAGNIPPFEIFIYTEAVQCKNLTLQKAWEETI